MVAVADVRREVAASCATKFGIPKAYTEHGPILGDPGIDAVLICSSTDTHVQIIEQAAEAGKDFFSSLS
ncbi:MAG: scyllo-inositol 2-dehydrogenase (NAD(+)) [Dehalococcoidia bacterium]|nr:scyllo-inositol 2-dehydrogenase (NAD(+)) [Chloroflexota bacterium]MBT9165753.1 scyllo-inositol 2-dehydrogenase (NAD(+)) [Chloroflexota bacterium]